MRVSVGPFDRRVQPERGARVGARHHQEVVVGPGVQRGRQRLLEHRGVDHLLVRQMAAPLREHLIFQLDCGHPGRLVGADGAYHVHRCAVAGVGVGDERDIAQRVGDHPDSVGHFGRGDQPDVGQPEPRGGHARTGHIRRDVAGALGQLRGDSVENPWRDDEFALVQQILAAVAGPVVVAMAVLSVQCARDGRGEQIDQVVDVVEVLETRRSPARSPRRVPAGHPVGQRMELRDQFVVGDRIGGCAMRLPRRGRGARRRRAWSPRRRCETAR